MSTAENFDDFDDFDDFDNYVQQELAHYYLSQPADYLKIETIFRRTALYQMLTQHLQEGGSIPDFLQTVEDDVGEVSAGVFSSE